MKRSLLIAAVVLALLLNNSVTGASTAEKGKKGATGTTAVKSVDKAGKSHVAKGYVAMKAAPGSKTFAADPKIQKAALPRKVDLRAGMTRIEDQGETSSCVANAVAGAFEYWVKRATKQDYDVSRLFIYFNARWRNGDQSKDEGSVIQLAMEGLKEFGACSEDHWPFSKPLLLKKPNGDAYKAADKVKIKEMNRVPLELTAWKQALASGYPIVFGCLLFDSFDDCNKRGGVVPMPNPEDLSRSSHSGHSMCVVGYSDKEQVFIVRNSWGAEWGDKGYCYVPYNYLMNPKFNGGDSWVFIPETPILNPEDTWFEDDKPVTDGGRGVDFIINTYTIESYAAVELTWWEEKTVEYSDAPPGQYIEYVQYSESDNWDSMEAFDYNEVVETWKEDHPGEDANLYVYDGADEEAVKAEVTEATPSGDEDAEAEASEEDSTPSGDDEAEVTEATPSGDEDAEAEASEEDSAPSGDDEAEVTEEAPSGDEDAEAESASEEDSGGGDDSSGGGDGGGDDSSGGGDGGGEAE